MTNTSRFGRSMWIRIILIAIAWTGACLVPTAEANNVTCECCGGVGCACQDCGFCGEYCLDDGCANYPCKCLGFTASWTENALSQGRKISITGMPMPDVAQHQEGESDYKRESTHVDALNLDLVHDVTDIHVLTTS